MSIRRVAVLTIGLLLLGYVGSYVALSARGGWYWSQTGRVRYTFGFAMTDVVRWHPAWARWEPFRDVHGRDTSRGNLAGYLYSPLIRLDRAWVHRDHELFAESNPATQPAATRPRSDG